MWLNGRRKRIPRESRKNPPGRTAKRKDSREEAVISDAPRPRSLSSRMSYSSCIVSLLRGRIPQESVIRCYKHNYLLARDQPRAFALNGCRAGHAEKNRSSDHARSTLRRIMARCLSRQSIWIYSYISIPNKK